MRKKLLRMSDYKNILILVGGLMLAAMSCGRKGEQDSGVIEVSLTDGRIEWEELFDSIRVVPLETSDSVLLTGAGRTMIWDGDMYILNRDRVFRFDSLGNFKNGIGKVGNWPGEYRYAYDFDFNPETGNLFILSPFGTAYEYTPDGEFIVSHELPAMPNYQRLRRLAGGKWMAWSVCYYDEQPISILSEDLSECIRTPEINLHMVDLHWANPDFFEYDSVLYMSPTFDQTVYVVSSDTIVPVYRWDFGAGNNISEEALAKYDETPSTDPNENWERAVAFFKDTDITHSVSSWINSRYILQMVVEKVGVDNHMKPTSIPKRHYIFHDRRSGCNVVGSQIGDGQMNGFILLMNDDYILAKMSWEDLPLYDQFLPEGMTLADINPDDDNPLLVKYYFKK